jgi:hypothetical protein
VGLSELQAAADAAAHTGADLLDGTRGGMSSAVAVAERVLAVNEVAGHAVDGADFTIETGIWREGAFTASSAADDVNALRVTLGDVTPAWMGSLIGGPPLTLGAAATAAKDGIGEVQCPLPMAMPSCAFSDLDSICFTDLTVTYSPDPVDNAGWALMNVSNVNANDVRNQLTSCSETYTGVVGDQVSLNNGQITSALQAVEDTLNDSGSLITELWDDGQWGSVPMPQPEDSDVKRSIYGNYAIVGQLPLFDGDGFCDGGRDDEYDDDCDDDKAKGKSDSKSSKKDDKDKDKDKDKDDDDDDDRDDDDDWDDDWDDDDDCGNSASKFNEKDVDVVGFATVGIYDVTTSGKDKLIRMRVLCDVDVNGHGGGVQSGTWSPPLVVR